MKNILVHKAPIYLLPLRVQWNVTRGGPPDRIGGRWGS